MKKLLSVLLISICLLGLVSCGEGVEFYKNATTSTAMLIPGNDFVDMLDTADKPVEKIRDPQLFDDVENIIFLANQNFSKHQIGVVSTDDSGCEAWIELDNNGKTLYVKTTGVGFKANEDCRNMFNAEYAQCLDNVKSIDFNKVVDTSSVAQVENMFSGLESLQYLNLEECKVSSFASNPFDEYFCFAVDQENKITNDNIVTVTFDADNRAKLYTWLVNDNASSVLATAEKTSFKVNEKSFAIKNAKNAVIVPETLNPVFARVLAYSGATKISFRASQYFEDFAGYQEYPSYTYVAEPPTEKIEMFTEVSEEYVFKDADFNLGTDTAPIWLTVENGTLYVNTTGNQFTGEMTELFKDLTTLKSIDFGNVVDTSLTESFASMCSGCSEIGSVKLGSGFRIKSGATTTSMFASVNSGSALHPIVISFNGTDNADLRNAIRATVSGEEDYIYLDGTENAKDSITVYSKPAAMISSSNTNLKEAGFASRSTSETVKFEVEDEFEDGVDENLADDDSAPIWVSYDEPNSTWTISTTARHFDFTSAGGFFELGSGATITFICNGATETALKYTGRIIAVNSEDTIEFEDYIESMEKVGFKATAVEPEPPSSGPV